MGDIQVIWGKYMYVICDFYPTSCMFSIPESWRVLFMNIYSNFAAVTWLKYGQYGVELYPINQSINQFKPFILVKFQTGLGKFMMFFINPIH